MIVPLADLGVPGHQLIIELIEQPQRQFIVGFSAPSARRAAEAGDDRGSCQRQRPDSRSRAWSNCSCETMSFDAKGKDRA